MSNQQARVDLGSCHLDLALHEVPYMNASVA